MPPQRCPPAFGMGFYFVFFQLCPQVALRERLRPAGPTWWGKAVQAAHAKMGFSLFPSKNSLGSFIARKTFRGKKKTNEMKSPPHTLVPVQIIKKKLSAGESENASRGRGGTSLVPIRQFHGKSTENPPRGPAGIKNWMQKDVQSVLITKHSKAS